MVFIFWILSAISFLAIIQWLGILGQLRKFIARNKTNGRAENETVDGTHPSLPDSLSIIVPIKGADESSKTALKQLLRLPFDDRVEILFVMEEESDPAFAMLESIMHEHPNSSHRCRLIMSGKCDSGMGKIHNMREGIRHASHEHILFMDADVEMTMGVIVQGLKALADPHTGTASAIPLYRHPVAWGETIITTWTNDYFFPCLLGLRQMKPFPFVIGACIFTRRHVLAVLNNLEGAEKYISDDAYFADQISQAGLKTRILPHAVTMSDSKTASEGWRHLLRWFIMLRHFNPFVYLSIHIWHSIYLSLLTTIMALFTKEAAYISISMILIAVAVASKLLGAIWLNNQLKTKEPLSRYLRIIVYECFIFPGVWLVGLLRSTLTWKGRKYTIGFKGVIQKVEED